MKKKKVVRKKVIKGKQKIYLGLFIVAVLVLGILVWNNYSRSSKICLRGAEEKCFRIEVADTTSERIEGLSGRTRMAENMGMLFVFESEGSPGFWMKNMKFPLDIIWIDSNFDVVGIEKNLQPCSSEGECSVYYPPKKIKYVLEINAGLSDKYGFQVSV